MQHVGACSPTGDRTPRPPALGARSLSHLRSEDSPAGHLFVPLLTHTFSCGWILGEGFNQCLYLLIKPPPQAVAGHSLAVLGGEGRSATGKFPDGAVFPGVGRWNVHFLFFRLPSSLKILLL